MNTEKYLKAKNWIQNADAIVIGAGAGLSAASGINYGEENFKEKYPELVSKYGFTDFYTSSFYKFATEEERWSYWAKHINSLCIGVAAKDTYKKLFTFVKDKDYFVLTTNVDEQFKKANFAESRIFATQGSLSKIQCSKACHNKLYDDTKLIAEMLKQDKDCKVPTELVPFCPVCGETMEVNLRKDNFFVEDDSWYKQNAEYEKFIQKNRNKRIVFIELGVGFNTPGIIRYPFENFTYHFKNANLIRVNKGYAYIPEEIESKALGFDEDINVFLNNI